MVFSSPFMPRLRPRAMSSAALHFMSASRRSRAFDHTSTALAGNSTITCVAGGNSGDLYIGESMTSSACAFAKKHGNTETKRQEDKETRRQGDKETGTRRNQVNIAIT